MKTEVLTNNPDIAAYMPADFSLVLMEEGDPSAVLLTARDRIHLGAKLLAHPMTGRLLPNETPYRMAVLECLQASSGPAKGSGPSLDLPSLEIIEYCLAEESKYAKMRKKYDAQVLADLRFIDCELFRSILLELGAR